MKFHEVKNIMSEKKKLPPPPPPPPGPPCRLWCESCGNVTNTKHSWLCNFIQRGNR